MLNSIRSERLLMEEIDYSVLLRWFVGMNMDGPVWDITVFTKNRDRLLDGDVAREFLGEVVRQAQERKLTSDEHFTVDGTLVEAWTSLKSFQRNDSKNPPPDDPGHPTVDFRGEQRSNQTHESTTDPDALLARKGNGKEAKLSYNGNLLVENLFAAHPGELAVDQIGAHFPRQRFVAPVPHMFQQQHAQHTTSASVALRPRVLLFWQRLANSCWITNSRASSSKAASACRIQGSQRSSTASAMKPSPKWRCRRRAAITTRAPVVWTLRGPDGIRTDSAR